jgi:predicted anti-sigma-YlaC factor YlaD
MQIDPHEQALRIIDKSLVAKISNEEEVQLSIHLRECQSCRSYHELSAHAAQVLNDFSFEVSPVLTSRIQQSITDRAEELQVNRARMQDVWWSFAAALFLTVAGSVVTWESASLLSPYFNVDQKQLQMVGLLFLLLPSLFASILLPVAGRLSYGGLAKEGLLS